MAQRQFRSDDTSKWTYGFGNGSDGDLTISADTTEAPIDASCSGTATQTSLAATNASFAAGQLILIHQTRGTGVGLWELNRIASYTAGTITLTYPLINTYTDSGASQAQVRVLKQYNNVTINSGQTYTSKAWNQDVGGIIGWFAKSTTVTGNVNVTGNTGTTTTGTGGAAVGKGFNGGNGIRTDAACQGGSGEGAPGASVAQTAANGNGGGGAYAHASGGTRRSGAGGGYGTAGSSSSTGVGGGTDGAASLTDMLFGGGGGGGANGDSNSSFTAGGGGGGGGIVLIISKAITITGAITANGGAGTAGGASNQSSGGGGAGGSVLIKAQTAVLGTNLITATAGAAAGESGAGGVGRIHLDYKTSVTGTTNPALDSTQDATLNDTNTGGFFAFL